MQIRPHDIHTPTRTDNGDGTWSEALGTAKTIYGVVRVHEGTTTFIASRHDLVSVADILVLQSGQYRVVGMNRTGHADRMILDLERIKKPIVAAKP